MHAHPETPKSWQEEFVMKWSGEGRVVKVTVNTDGNAKTDDMVEQCANDHEKVE